jgi:anti-sigma factor RsiW
MLPERITQLLTSYIDGELSTRQRKAVTRLLRKSPEARKLLQEMQEDSMILRKLPRKKMKQDLSRTLPGTIIMRGLQLPPPPTVALPPSVPTWIVAVCAVVLLGLVGVGSYLFFTAGEHKAPVPAATSPKTEPMKSSIPTRR